MKKPLLLTPGPTPLPPRVLAAMAQPIFYHRSEDFKNLWKDCHPILQKLFGTKEPVALLTSSGTGAMEACVRSCLGLKDKVLVVSAGKFGERFAQLAKAFHLNVEVLSVTWGSTVSLPALARAFSPQTTALLIQHSETSTGSLHPIAEISAWLKREHPDCLLIVDGITSIGAMPFEMDAWGLDAAITGSQKALMLPPGLSFVALSKRARERARAASLSGYYFDLDRELLAQEKFQTAFTPNVSLVMALKESLSMIMEEGPQNVFRRHERLATATRAAMSAMNLTLASESPGVACTAVRAPAGVTIKTILKEIEETHGFRIAGAQGEWEGKVFRLSHLGYTSAFDTLGAITALGCALKRANANVDLTRAFDVFVKEAHL